MNKSMLLIGVAAILLVFTGFALLNKPMAVKAADSRPEQDEWQANLQRQKKTPFQDGTFTPRGGEPVALQYRVFKPTIDLDQLREEPPNWRDDPVDSFLRQRYVISFDPKPTYEKYAESFVDGMDAVNEIVNKIPQFKNDPKGFFQKGRGKVDERKLIGEILIEGIHIFVYVVVDEYGPERRGITFVKTDDGKFLAAPKLMRTNKLVNALAQDRYTIIFNHFPEYSNKK